MPKAIIPPPMQIIQCFSSRKNPARLPLLYQGWVAGTRLSWNSPKDLQNIHAFGVR
jgi:hypothetical protein